MWREAPLYELRYRPSQPVVWPEGFYNSPPGYSLGERCRNDKIEFRPCGRRCSDGASCRVFCLLQPPPAALRVHVPHPACWCPPILDRCLVSPVTSRRRNVSMRRGNYPVLP